MWDVSTFELSGEKVFAASYCRTPGVMIRRDIAIGAGVFGIFSELKKLRAQTKDFQGRQEQFSDSRNMIGCCNHKFRKPFQQSVAS